MSLGRILLAVVLAACLLSVGVLEVLSERAPRQQLLPMFPKVGDLRSDDAEPWWESGETVSDRGLEWALATPEGALTRDAEPRGLGGCTEHVVVLRHGEQSEGGAITSD